MRHSLYLGCVLMLFGAPLLLGSIIGLVIGVIGPIVLIARILGEENYWRMSCKATVFTRAR